MQEYGYLKIMIGANFNNTRHGCLYWDALVSLTDVALQYLQYECLE